MIQTHNLSKQFGSKEVLRDISFTFETGKTNLIIGQSGSGKTVLMKNLVGLLEPTTGAVLYDGRDFVKMNKNERAHLRREMGMIFQNAALFDSLSVLENVMFPLDMFSTMTRRERERRAMECLERVNLKGAEGKYPAEPVGRYAEACGHSAGHCIKPQIPLLRRAQLWLGPQDIARNRRTALRHHPRLRHDHHHQHPRHELRDGHWRKHPVHL